MAQEPVGVQRPEFWIVLVGIVIVLIFLYFYGPFESYVSDSIGEIRARNVIFWFAALVGAVGYAIAHFASYRRTIFRRAGEIDADSLVFDTLQITILIAVIISAGATLQAVELLGEHLIKQGAIIDPVFGRRLLSVVLLVILSIVFYLLHLVVRAFRVGWRPRRPPRSTSSRPGSPSAS